MFLSALRRALVQPALACGYRFEDDGLVEEMVSEVSHERGVLPLLAFAASRLWEKRDREKGLLTREAYEEIGGVGGALARHAEETLKRIGAERTPLVRELFRNLVTAEGTRASRDVEELLSIFPKEDERKAAEEVLRELVAARLLTSYETTVEIIHESLLSAWPRLVQWRNQDEGGALLRDQLRQAAQAWQDRGRPEDLLWTGKSYRELSLWRESYTGGLSSAEEAFAQAAAKLAGRRRRRRRIAVFAGAALLSGVALATSSLWRRAVHEVSRREAAQILALGRLDLQDRPSAALAHALASLERADNEPARRFAVEALWHGGASIVLEGNINVGDFSPDGKWLATGGIQRGIRLWSREGGAPETLGEGGSHVQFNPGSEFLAVPGERVRFLSIPEGRELRSVELGGGTIFRRRGGHLFSFTNTSETTRALRDWSVPGANPNATQFDISEVSDWTILASSGWFVTGRGNGVYLSPLRDPADEALRLIGTQEARVAWLNPHPTAPRFVSRDEKGEIRIWSVSGTSGRVERSFRSPAPEVEAYLDPTDSWMVAAPAGGHPTSAVAYLWDLKGPPDAEPVVVRNGSVNFGTSAAIDPEGRWLLTANGDSGILWPLDSKHPRVLRGHSPPYITVAFTPDGKRLVSHSDDGTVRLWPLSYQNGERGRVLMEGGGLLGNSMGLEPSGRYVLVTARFRPRVFLVPLEGGEPREMPGFNEGEGWVFSPAFSPDGRLAVAEGMLPSILRIWDLDAGGVRTVDTRVPDEEGCLPENFRGSFASGQFLADGRFLSVGEQGIRIWDLEHGTSRQIRPCREEVDTMLSLDRERRRALVVYPDAVKRESTLGVLDVETGAFQEIASHSNRVSAAAFDSTGTMVVTGDFDGVVRVGPASGSAPHLLYGHTLDISSVAVSPDGKWIASGSQDGTIRLWPMPPVGEVTPFHRLPYEEILDRLRALTNLRVVPDERSDKGYRVSIGPFPGWNKLPEW